MLPPTHVGYTWGGLWLAQRGLRLFPEADYRWVALASILPDVLDKALVLTILGDRYETGQLYGHSLILHGAVLLALAAWGRDLLVYGLALMGHLLLDRMWRYPGTLFYPLLGENFSTWTDLSTVEAMAEAYWGIYREQVALWVLELAGLAILAAFVWRAKLYRWARLRRFLSMGQVPPEVDG